MQPELTISLVNYNSGEYLSRCLSSIRSNTVNVDIMVVDNASTDQSLARVLLQYPEVTVIKNSKNLGFARAHNQILDQLKTPYVLLLNPDCILEPHTLEVLLDTLKQNPKTGMVGCLVNNLDATEQASCRGLTPTPMRVARQLLGLSNGYLLQNQPLPESSILVELISGACMLVRKSAIEAVGLLDEDYFLYCEDYDWFYRFIKNNWEIRFTPNTQITHAKGISGRSTPIKILKYKAQGMKRYYNKFFKPHAPWYQNLLINIAIIIRFSALALYRQIRR